MARKIVHTEESVLLDVHGLATMLNRSGRTIHRLNDSGKIPKPVRIMRGLLFKVLCLAGLLLRSFGR